MWKKLSLIWIDMDNNQAAKLISALVSEGKQEDQSDQSVRNRLHKRVPSQFKTQHHAACFKKVAVKMNN